MTDEVKKKEDKIRDSGADVASTEEPSIEENLQEEEEEPSLEQQLEAARLEAAQNLEGWQRARAEFANYRKRIDRERSDIYQNATVAVLKQLLPVIDDLDRAMGNVPEDISEHNWAQGVTLIGQKLNALLESNGLVPLSPTGEAFDPNLHEAVGMDETDEFESGHVTVVLQKGYAYGDRVVRPAMVRVANSAIYLTSSELS